MNRMNQLFVFRSNSHDVLKLNVKEGGEMGFTFPVWPNFFCHNVKDLRNSSSAPQISTDSEGPLVLFREGINEIRLLTACTSAARRSVVTNLS